MDLIFRSVTDKDRFLVELMRFMETWRIKVERIDQLQRKKRLEPDAKKASPVWIVKLLDVRLKTSKEYCGNHPESCEIGNPRHTKARYLEGADWVEFNDTLNDILDRLELWADVASSLCVVRRGFMRRVEYDSDPRFPKGNGRNAQWAREGVHENWCGKQAEPSWFPEGTPGQYREIYDVVG